MSVTEKVRHIIEELKGHAPFTLFGAFLGIVFMLFFRKAGGAGNHTLFNIFHPAHVLLSAIVTASMFGLHAARRRFVLMLLVGYFGSVGIATLSDIIIPHASASLLGLNVPTHAEFHQLGSTDTDTDLHEHEQDYKNLNEESENQRRKIHLGFIEEWYLVNPAAILGILIAYYLPRTKFPHAAHVLISTWASSSYLLICCIRDEITIPAITAIFATLFIATWVPCCISDIVFPLLFVKSDLKISVPCEIHTHHSHPHKDKSEKTNEDEYKQEN